MEQVHDRALRRLRRSWMRYPVVYGATLAAVYLVLGQSTSHIVTAATTGFLISVIITFGVLRRMRGGWQPVNLQLGWGLRRGDRRTTRRDILRGEPNDDPTLRSVEIADADVMARTYGWAALLAGAGTGLTALFSGSGATNWRERGIAVILLILLVISTAWCLTWWVAARRFLRGPKPR